MSFFRNMNLARAIILVAFIGSIFLAWKNYQDRQTLDRFETALRKDVPDTVENIQRLSQQYSKLVQSKAEDGLARESSPQSYIATVRDMRGAELGLMDVTTNESSYDGNIEDVKITVRPFEKESKFTRNQLAYFMYEIERGSNRMKITDIDLQLAERRGLKNEDIPTDFWTYRIEMTTRQEKAGN